MKIGVLYNCQADGIAAWLRALLPDAEILCVTGGAVAGRADLQAATAAALNACDDVISCGFGPAFGPLAGKALVHTVRRYHVLPAVTFGGFHPDMIYIQSPAGALLQGPTGDYHSRIGAAAFLAGLPAAETAALFNLLSFRRLGYLDAFARHTTLLSEHFARHGIDAAPLLRGWLATGCFMHSLNHPKMNVLRDVALAACARIGVTPRAPWPETPPPDRLVRGPIHPLFPDIAAAAGVPPEGVFRDGMRQDGGFAAMSLEQFLAASFVAFANMPRAALEAADGVPAAVAALGI